MSSRDRRREKQSPLAREQQALTDERTAHDTVYARLTAEAARLDRALGEAYEDLDAVRQQLRETRAETDKVEEERDRLIHDIDVLREDRNQLNTKLVILTAHVASLEATVLHVEVDHNHPPAPPPGDDEGY